MDLETMTAKELFDLRDGLQKAREQLLEVRVDASYETDLLDAVEEELTHRDDVAQTEPTVLVKNSKGEEVFPCCDECAYWTKMEKGEL